MIPPVQSKAVIIHVSLRELNPVKILPRVQSTEGIIHVRLCEL